MTSLERVRKAIHFGGPDRIPHLLPDGRENDILWLWLRRPPERQPWTPYGGHERRVDEWGVVWEKSERNSMGEAVAWPIPDITRQAEYAFPDMNNRVYYEEARSNIEFCKSSGEEKYCLGVMPFSALNEGTHCVMGLEAMFAAYYEHPDDLKALIARMAEKQRESIRMLAGIGCHGVMGYDDWGLQDRLMIGLALFEEFFLPSYRENWRLAHDLGMDVWLHSCGHIIELLPLFIDAGLNVIQMDQQENMGLENLDRMAGGRLAFWCPVDIQRTMVQGTIEDIRQYVKRMMATVGNHRGGLISMTYSTPQAVGHSQEKIDAMCAAFREYGVYGENRDRHPFSRCHSGEITERARRENRCLSLFSEGEIHVWLADLEQPREYIERFRRTLSEDETARAERFAFADLRNRYVAGRGILRDILARYCGTDASALRFEYSRRGKPSLAGMEKEQRLEFNVSHSGELFMCAIACGSRVGIDIEKIEFREDFLKLAQRFFAPSEADGIRDLSPEQQLDAFYACWTRKEAYVKGKGDGLATPLDKFEVSLKPGAPPALLCSHVDPEDLARWALFDVTPCSGYAAALAVENPDVRITCWKWLPA